MIEGVLLFFNEKEESMKLNSQITNSYFSYFPSLVITSRHDSKLFLMNLNKELDSLNELWTPKMRQEYWKVMKNLNDKLQKSSSEHDNDYIPLETYIVAHEKQGQEIELIFPEIKEEIIINKIFLRSFIKTPHLLDISKEFVDELIVDFLAT